MTNSRGTPRATVVRQIVRIGQLLWSPQAALQDLASHPGFIVPFAMVTVGGILISLLLTPYAMRALELGARSALSPDQVDGALQFAGRWHGITAGLTPLAVLLRWTFIAGLISAAMTFLEERMTFRVTFSLIACAGVVSLCQSCFETTILLLRGIDRVRAPSDLQPPIGLNLLFLDALEPLYTVLGAVNLFEVWYLAILFIGIRTLTRLSRAKAWAVVIGTWLTVLGFKAAVATLTIQ